MPELTLVLVHSPLVGPLTWEPTAKRLRQMGYQVLVPSLAGIVGGAPPYYRKLAGRAAETIHGRLVAALQGDVSPAAVLALLSIAGCAQVGKGKAPPPVVTKG